MWAYGNHYHIEAIDQRRVTMDSVIVASFKQQSRASVRDANVVGDELTYIGILEDILGVNYRVFKTIIFKVRWFQTMYRGSNATIRKEENGFYAVDSTKVLGSHDEPFIFPRHCQQAFLFADDVDRNWLTVLHVNPRRRPIFQHIDEEGSSSMTKEEEGSNVASAPSIDVHLAENDASNNDEHNTHQNVIDNYEELPEAEDDVDDFPTNALDLKTIENVEQLEDENIEL
eukprot:c29400_g1_i1 orf=346-1032(-)